jgi:hypothetical protein
MRGLVRARRLGFCPGGGRGLGLCGGCLLIDSELVDVQTLDLKVFDLEVPDDGASDRQPAYREGAEAPAPTAAAPTVVAPRRAAGSCTVARSCRPRRRLERVRVGCLRLFINRSSFADDQTWRHSHYPNSSSTIAARWPATAAGWPGSAPCTSRSSIRSSGPRPDEAAARVSLSARPPAPA